MKQTNKQKNSASVFFRLVIIVSVDIYSGTEDEDEEVEEWRFFFTYLIFAVCAKKRRRRSSFFFATTHLPFERRDLVDWHRGRSESHVHTRGPRKSHLRTKILERKKETGESFQRTSRRSRKCLTADSLT